MSEETITVAEISDGPGGDTNLAPGTRISLPVVELLTGRGFVTGKSGSGKSNSASVIVENLLDNNFPVLIVDADGEYYGLKETYEVLHAGADEECDIQVSPEHAERLATLALEQNVPIVLDVSGFLDEQTADELVRRTARQLFVKEKKLKKPFLMLIEECHEYIPESAGIDETGKTLIKIGKRGRKHGLGIVGISQRPADVKKDFITQCDWLTWHRLTWDNDTKVVRRILGSEYADAIEEMDDGEAFLMTDWAESIRRVKFDRKETFDAGATPGLDDFERPELKSVSSNLVSELESITDQRERRESELAELRQELDEKRQQISKLERELEEARDMSQMADKFAQALLRKADAPYRGGDGHNPARARLDRITGGDDEPEAVGLTDEAAFGSDSSSGGRVVTATDANGSVPDRSPGDAAVSADGNGRQPTDAGGENAAGGAGSAGGGENSPASGEPSAASGEPTQPGTESSAAGDSDGAASGDPGAAGVDSDATSGEDTSRVDADHTTSQRDPPTAGSVSASTTATAGGVTAAGGTVVDPGVPTVQRDDLASAPSRPSFDERSRMTAFARGTELRDRQTVVEGFLAAIEELPSVTRRMLDHYRTVGTAQPIEAHIAADGSGDRAFAYARNGTLRQSGVIEHVGCGLYAYRLPKLVRSVYAGASEQELAETVAEIEGQAGLVTDD